MVKKRALMIGRFQPFHNGHLSVIKEYSDEYEEIIIGIGSAQYGYTEDNPFTSGERYYMIRSSLLAEGIHNFSIVPIENLNRYSMWVSQVETICPRFDVVLTNNNITKRLFTESGYEVKNTKLYGRNVYSGSIIRNKIKNGDEWKSLVPTPVYNFLQVINVKERLVDVSGRETVYS